MKVIALALAAAALATNEGGEVVEMGTTVIGNQEQPRVLYIVPWQAPDGPDSLYQDFSTRIDNLLDPVVRESFQRELELRQRFERLSRDSARQ